MEAAHLRTVSTICSWTLQNQASWFSVLSRFRVGFHLGPLSQINLEHISTPSRLNRQAEEFCCNILDYESHMWGSWSEIYRVCDSDENTARQLPGDKSFRCHRQNKRTQFSPSLRKRSCISHRLQWLCENTLLTPRWFMGGNRPDEQRLRMVCVVQESGESERRECVKWTVINVEEGRREEKAGTFFSHPAGR